MGYTWDNFDEGEFRSASDGRRNQSVGDFRSGGWGGGVLSRSKFIRTRNWRLRPRKGGFFCEEDGGGRPNPYSCTGATMVVLIVIGATVVVLIVVVVLVMMVAVAPATVVVLVVVLVMVTMVAVAMVIVVSC